MTSVIIVTNRCCWRTSIYSITTIFHNEMIRSSIWICDCHCMTAIWIFYCCSSCRFTIFTVFDDSICNITISICHSNGMTSISIIDYFNFRSLTISNNYFFRRSIWIYNSNCMTSIWIFCCCNSCCFSIFTIFNFSR